MFDAEGNTDEPEHTGVLTKFLQAFEPWIEKTSKKEVRISRKSVIMSRLSRDRTTGPLTVSAKAGLAIAALSLGLMWKPISDGVIRYKQQRNLAMRDVPAPSFDTVDLSGKMEHLQDQKGKVVLVNIWATWCGPCREEFPRLDHLYQEHKDQGFVVFGFSTEDPAVQRKFVRQVPVTFPLLTTGAGVPDFYKDIARYPAFILVDRKGQLQTAPAPDDGFRKLEATIDALLK